MAVGTVLNDRYELRELLGRGGFADVYRALDRALDREVAVKILHPAMAADPDFVRRFSREARAAARLNHPNVVSVYDWGTGPDGDFLVMEWVQGPDLKTLISRNGPLQETRALGIAQGVAAGLEAAHRLGVVHRDIKPQNILLAGGTVPKVTDFGIAHAADLTQVTQAGMLSGTAQYLSPEGARGLPGDERSDVYGLGVVLYEMLTGRPPFTAETPVAVAMKHLSEDPVPPANLRPDLSATTNTLVLRALAKDPAARFPTVGAMRAALDEARRDAVVLTPVRRVVDHPEEETVSLPLTETQIVRVPRRVTWLPLALLALLLVAAGAVLAAQALPAHHSHVALPPATPTSPPPTRLPATSAPPTLSPTTAAPSAAPTVVPPPTVLPSASVPPVAASSGAPSGATSPTAAVLAFYTDVAYHRFTAAQTLWTPHMQATCPPDQCINAHFGATNAVNVRQAQVVNAHGNNATVAVDVVIAGGGTQEFTGNWYVVHGPGGWLLNGESLTAVASTNGNVVSAPGRSGHEGPPPGHGHSHGGNDEGK